MVCYSPLKNDWWMGAQAPPYPLVCYSPLKNNWWRGHIYVLPFSRLLTTLLPLWATSSPLTLLDGGNKFPPSPPLIISRKRYDKRAFWATSSPLTLLAQSQRDFAKGLVRRTITLLAQLEERIPSKDEATGSSPVGGVYLTLTFNNSNY